MNKQQLSQRFKNTRVLVTGHTGFKGSWLTLWLNDLRAKVTGYALDPRNTNDHFNLLSVNSDIIDVRGDITHYTELKKVFDDTCPEVVFHLAAQALVLDSYQYPRETYETNIQGTVNVLECCRLTDSVKSVVVITSDKCYANQEWLWGYRENDILGGYDPYSASKACAEIVTSSYIKAFLQSTTNKGIASARAGNVIGGGDWAKNRIIPDCIKSLISKQNIVVRNPYSIRPWQHVLDPLYGYLKLANKLLDEPARFNGAWNFGPEITSMKNVKELVGKVIESWGCGAWKQEENTSAPHEAKTLFLDITKARDYLKWNPVWGFDTAVENTIEWYLEYSQGSSMKEISLKQIERYMDSIGS